MKCLIKYENQEMGFVSSIEVEEQDFRNTFLQMTNDPNIFIIDVYKQLTYKEILELTTKIYW